MMQYAAVQRMAPSIINRSWLFYVFHQSFWRMKLRDTSNSCLTPTMFRARARMTTSRQPAEGWLLKPNDHSASHSVLCSNAAEVHPCLELLIAAHCDNSFTNMKKSHDPLMSQSGFNDYKLTFWTDYAASWTGNSNTTSLPVSFL